LGEAILREKVLERAKPCPGTDALHQTICFLRHEVEPERKIPDENISQSVPEKQHDVTIFFLLVFVCTWLHPLWLTFLVLLVYSMLVGPVYEELGWQGFALQIRCPRPYRAG
jgi:hypothetical protein